MSNFISPACKADCNPKLRASDCKIRKSVGSCSRCKPDLEDSHFENDISEKLNRETYLDDIVITSLKLDSIHYVGKKADLFDNVYIISHLIVPAHKLVLPVGNIL